MHNFSFMLIWMPIMNGICIKTSVSLVLKKYKMFINLRKIIWQLREYRCTLSSLRHKKHGWTMILSSNECYGNHADRMLKLSKFCAETHLYSFRTVLEAVSTDKSQVNRKRVSAPKVQKRWMKCAIVGWMALRGWPGQHVELTIKVSGALFSCWTVVQLWVVKIW